MAALRHLSMDGMEDLKDPPNVRVFLFAGTQHRPGHVASGDNGGHRWQVAATLNDYRWLESALYSPTWIAGCGGRGAAAQQPSDASRRDVVAQKQDEFPQKCPACDGRITSRRLSDHLPGPLSALPFLVREWIATATISASCARRNWRYRWEPTPIRDFGASHRFARYFNCHGWIIHSILRKHASNVRSGDPRLSIEERTRTDPTTGGVQEPRPG